MSLDTFWIFLQQGVLSGIVTGSVFALLALAIVMIFKTSEIANFGQGEVFMAAAYVALYLVALRHVAMWLAIPATLVVACVGMILFQRVVLRQVQAAGAAPVHFVIATLGLSYLLKGVVRQTGFGDTPRTFPALVPMDPVVIGQAIVTKLDVAIVATSVAVMAAVFALFFGTRIGRAMRAVGMNRRAAALVGINLGGVDAFIWGLSGLVSAIAALLISPKLLITADMGDIAVVAFAAAIVGGFSSFPGAVIGGFLVGVTQNLVGLFTSSTAITVTPFVVIMLVLVIRPQGLFGRHLGPKKV